MTDDPEVEVFMGGLAGKRPAVSQFNSQVVQIIVTYTPTVGTRKSKLRNQCNRAPEGHEQQFQAKVPTPALNRHYKKAPPL